MAAERGAVLRRADARSLLEDIPLVEYSSQEMSKPLVPKSVRVQELLQRLRTAPAAGTEDDAKRLIDETLNEVEDELTDIPFNPERWRTDGRMYPVQDDYASVVDAHPDITSYRSRRHETFIRANGAFEIRDVLTNEVLLAKPGADGTGVWL